MKIKSLFWTLSLLALFVACSNEFKESDGQDQSGENVSQLDPFAEGLKLSLSRRYLVTAADEQINAYYPLEWNKEAQVAVNGFVSEHTAIDAAVGAAIGAVATLVLGAVSFPVSLAIGGLAVLTTTVADYAVKQVTDDGDGLVETVSDWILDDVVADWFNW